MNIIFTMQVHTFEQAAILEKSLKENGLKYTSRVEDKPSLGAGKTKTRRVVIGKPELAAVLQCIASHPKWALADIAKSTGVSRATVGRISLGTHVLQANGAASDISEDI